MSLSEKIGCIFVCASIALTGVTITIWDLHRTAEYLSKKEKKHLELVQKAEKFADQNHDGILSSEEKFKMYQEIGIPIIIPGKTRYATDKELSDYTKRHELEKER